MLNLMVTLAAAASGLAGPAPAACVGPECTFAPANPAMVFAPPAAVAPCVQACAPAPETIFLRDTDFSGGVGPVYVGGGRGGGWINDFGSGFDAASVRVRALSSAQAMAQADASADINVTVNTTIKGGGVEGGDHGKPPYGGKPGGGYQKPGEHQKPGQPQKPGGGYGGKSGKPW